MLRDTKSIYHDFISFRMEKIILFNVYCIEKESRNMVLVTIGTDLLLLCALLFCVTVAVAGRSITSTRIVILKYQLHIFFTCFNSKQQLIMRHGWFHEKFKQNLWVLLRYEVWRSPVSQIHSTSILSRYVLLKYSRNQ